MTASVGSMIFGVGALLEAHVARAVENSSSHILSPFSFLVLQCSVSAIDGECLTDHEACAGAASQGMAEAISSGRPNGPMAGPLWISFMTSGSLANMVCNRWRIDHPWAHGVDADTPGGTFERSPLRQPD